MRRLRELSAKRLGEVRVEKFVGTLYSEGLMSLGFQEDFRAEIP